MKKRLSPLSGISPVMLIVVTILLIALVPFLGRWEEFAAAGILCVFLAVAGKTDGGFWLRFAKVSLPLVVLSAAFNWILLFEGGAKTFFSFNWTFTDPRNLSVLWTALAIGARFALALFFSLLLVHVSTHQELIWGLGRLSDRIFSSPVTGEVLALALLSVPFFLESLSRIRRWREIPQAIADVFSEARTIVSHPVKIGRKRPGWVMLTVSVFLLTAAVVFR